MQPTSREPLRLITIPISHFCEKARWALNRAGLPYQEERHLQLFHVPYTYGAGKSFSVPLLRTPKQTLTDSTDILKWIDTQVSDELKLYPSDPNLRKEVEDFEDYLDEGFGFAGSKWMYSQLLDRIELLKKYSALHRVPKHELLLLPLIFPFAKKFIRKVLEIKPSSQADSFVEINEVFEKVATRLKDGRAFLYGDRFTAADLTFAALSAAVLIPENYGVQLPYINELPEDMRAQILKWREHPAGKFALKFYTNKTF